MVPMQVNVVHRMDYRSILVHFIITYAPIPTQPTFNIYPVIIIYDILIWERVLVFIFSLCYTKPDATYVYSLLHSPYDTEQIGEKSVHECSRCRAAGTSCKPAPCALFIL